MDIKCTPGSHSTVQSWLEQWEYIAPKIDPGDYYRLELYDPDSGEIVDSLEYRHVSAIYTGLVFSDRECLCRVTPMWSSTAREYRFFFRLENGQLFEISVVSTGFKRALDAMVETPLYASKSAYGTWIGASRRTLTQGRNCWPHIIGHVITDTHPITFQY